MELAHYSFPTLQRAGDATAAPGNKNLSCGVQGVTNTLQIGGERSVCSFSVLISCLTSFNLSASVCALK